VSGNAGAILFTLGAGVAAAVQIAVNAALGRRIGTLEAATFQTLVGALTFTVVLLLVRHGFSGIGNAFREPPWLWIGGLMGAIIVGAITFVPQRIGAFAFSGLLIATQLLIAAVLDAFGWLGLERIGLSWPRALGIALLAVGAALALRR
jgi:transporter family-2 protein